MKWFPLNRRLLPAPSSSRPQRASLPVKYGDKYDEASGQVYTETYISIPSGSDQDWARMGLVVRDQHEKKNFGYESAHAASPGIIASKGSRSLQDIAMDTALDNLANITIEYLEALPTSLVNRMWRVANERSVSTHGAFYAMIQLGPL
jgi:hypothetical protein